MAGEGTDSTASGDDVDDERDATEGVMLYRGVVGGVGAMAVATLLVFAVSGVWPPMVVVESGSMSPHVNTSDLVFVTSPRRFAPAGTHHDGVVTYREGERSGYRSLGSYGDVIVFRPNGGNEMPIIHRARFWVQKGENWYPRANHSDVAARNCAELADCPAPYSGFVTKGDANPTYDQVNGNSGLVRPQWVIGKGELRVPWLGWLRLQFEGVLDASNAGPEFETAVRPSGDSAADAQPSRRAAA